MSTSTSSIESSGLRRASRRPTRIFKGHTKWVSSVAYFPDGRRMVSAANKTAIIWDVESGRRDGPSLHHDSRVIWIAMSPDGRRIASGMQKGGVVVWDVLTQEVVHELKGGGVRRLAYSPGGRWIVTAPWDNESLVRLWDADTGRPGREPLKCDDDVYCVVFSPDGSRIAVGLENSFEVIDIVTGESVVGPVKGHTGSVWSLVYSPDGRLLVTASDDENIRVWDSETGVQVGKPMVGHKAGECISISPDGRRIASGGGDTVRVWDLETRLQVGVSFDTNGRVFPVAFSPNSRYIITRNQHDVLLWDIESFATQGSASPPTASNQNPPVRDHARSVASSILDLPAVLRQDDGSPSESESPRRSSFDSILDLPAVLEPTKRRPKKNRSHSSESRRPRIRPIEPQRDPPLEQDTSPVQPAASGRKWSRNIRERWRRIRRRKSRVPADLPGSPPHLPLELHQRANAPASRELPINQQARRERAADTRGNAQAYHPRTQPSGHHDEANVALGKLDERLYAAPPRDRIERRRWRARERRRAARNNGSDSEPEDDDAESYYEDTGVLGCLLFPGVR